jgi:hypothetical protein
MNQDEQNKEKKYGRQHGPYWKRAHHDWRFWLVVFLMLVAIVYYIMSVDFAFSPAHQVKLP